MMDKMRDYLRLWRPKHWAKNAFVFMPVPFALAAGGEFDLSYFAVGLIGFCLVNSAVYAFNDVLAARRLPKKTDDEQRIRDEAIEQANQAATRVPLTVLEQAVEALAARQLYQAERLRVVGDVRASSLARTVTSVRDSCCT